MPALQDDPDFLYPQMVLLHHRRHQQAIMAVAFAGSKRPEKEAPSAFSRIHFVGMDIPHHSGPHSGCGMKDCGEHRYPQNSERG